MHVGGVIDTRRLEHYDHPLRSSLHPPARVGATETHLLSRTCCLAPTSEQTSSDIDSTNFIAASNQSSSEDTDQFLTDHVMDVGDPKDGPFLYTPTKQRTTKQRLDQTRSSPCKRRGEAPGEIPLRTHPLPSLNFIHYDHEAQHTKKPRRRNGVTRKPSGTRPSGTEPGSSIITTTDRSIDFTVQLQKLQG